MIVTISTPHRIRQYRITDRWKRYGWIALVSGVVLTVGTGAYLAYLKARINAQERTIALLQTAQPTVTVITRIAEAAQLQSTAPVSPPHPERTEPLACVETHATDPNQTADAQANHSVRLQLLASHTPERDGETPLRLSRSKPSAEVLLPYVTWVASDLLPAASRSFRRAYAEVNATAIRSPDALPADTASSSLHSKTFADHPADLNDPFVVMMWSRRAEQFHLYAPLTHTRDRLSSGRSRQAAYAPNAPRRPPSRAPSPDRAAETVVVEQTYGIRNVGRHNAPLWRKKQHTRILKIAMGQLGKHYVWGAVGPRTFDCSGFTSYVYRRLGIAIPRTSQRQSQFGKLVRRNQLQPGDLVFFDTSRRRRGYVNHVGIYIGGNKFIHASSAKHKVTITSLNNAFYQRRFKWARRIN